MAREPPVTAAHLAARLDRLPPSRAHHSILDVAVLGRRSAGRPLEAVAMSSVSDGGHHGGRTKEEPWRP
ncbi:hypothetical protein [Actinomadura kijaniata]|uniref:hypothetical protein n=1 Tax=Actinomadura kijaniata TaxID=46161 RepID=UPI000AC788E4|nr:hypothetical protein [Actinomadura kijaniata]